MSTINQLFSKSRNTDKTTSNFKTFDPVAEESMLLNPVSLQINLHIKKIQLTVPSPLKVKLMWIRGSKKMETKKKVTIDPKNSSTIFTETMSLATKFHPDPNNPTQYKRKRCYLQLMAMTKGQLKPVGILPFNLSEFVKISPNSVMKLTFAKCFDKKAAIILSTSSKEIEQCSEMLETESNATFETFSDTFSEFGTGRSHFEQTFTKPIQASFSTCEGTNKGSQIDSETRSASFVSAAQECTSQNSEHLIQKSELPKEKLHLQKLQNELSHFKNLVSELTTKQQESDRQVKLSQEEVKRFQNANREKDELIATLKQELQSKMDNERAVEEQHALSAHKLKMKIDYLTKKCFQLNCKLDKNDFTPDQKAESEDLGMLVDIIEKKQKEYCDTEKNQLQDPTDFLFHIFAQYEHMQGSIRRLSEQNNQLKQDLIEIKVKWAESEGEKEKLEILTDSLKNKLQRVSIEGM